ncbi:MAG: DinB family protein [Pirellulales bacterium]
MLDTFKELIGHQFEAAFCALNACVERCPEAAWNAPVANLAFCQVAFHTLFFADFYLGQNEDAFRQQPFHREHALFFRDYEELEDRKQQLLYDRPSITVYLQHCRQKAAQVIAAETTESLTVLAGFPWLKFSRAELHVYNIRHIQHHAAQLSLRLRIDFNADLPWCRSGWRDS